MGFPNSRLLKLLRTPSKTKPAPFLHIMKDSVITNFKTVHDHVEFLRSCWSWLINKNIHIWFFLVALGVLSKTVRIGLISLK